MPEESIKVFFSYSHRDEEFKDELVKHLSILQRQGVISGWNDRMIVPGAEWDREIETYLSSADIILLMVSPDFLASNYCWGVEVKKAMERHEAEEACVIPVVLRWVDWAGAPFAKLQALPKNAQPIKDWDDQDKAFTNITQGIRATASTIRQRQQGFQHRQTEINPDRGERFGDSGASGRTRQTEKRDQPIFSLNHLRRKFSILVPSGIAITVVLAIGVTFSSLDQSKSKSPRQSSESSTSSTNRQMSAKDFFDQALEKRKKGDNQGAIVDYDQAIKLKPDYSTAYNSRGNVRSDLGDKKGALEDYTKAIEINNNWGGYNPNYFGLPTAYYNRGIARSALGDKNGAIVDYDQAIKLKPDDAAAYNNRGIARSALGDKKEAISEYTKAIEINRNWGNIGLHTAYNNRGNARSALGDKNGAIVDFNQAIKLNPDYAIAYGNRGVVRSDLGDKKGAISDYDQAIKLKPDYATAYNNRGNAHSALGDKNGAIVDFQQAADLYQKQGNTKDYQDVLDQIKRLQS